MLDDERIVIIVKSSIISIKTVKMLNFAYNLIKLLER